MFYNYALPFDSAGANQFSKVLDVTATQRADLQEYTGSVHKTIDVTSPQNATFPSYIPAFPGYNPWSPLYSLAYGAGIIGGMAVGKALGAPSTGTVDSSRFGFFSPFVTAGTATTQSTSYSYLYTASLPLFASLANVAFVYFPRLYHSVASTRMPNIASWKQGLSRAFGINTSHVETLSLSVGQILNQTMSSPAVGAQSTALTNGVGRLMLALSASGALILRGPGRIARTLGHGSVARRLLQPIKLLAAASAEAADILRQTGLARSAATPEAPRLSFGGNLYAKFLPLVSDQSLAVAHGIFALRGAVTVGRAALVRSIAHLLQVANPSSTAMIRSVSWLRGVATSTSVRVVLTVGILRRTVSANVAALTAVAAHFVTGLAVAQASLTSLFPLIGAATKFKVVGLAQTTVAHLSSMRTYLRSLVVASAEAVSLVCGVSLAMASVAVASVTEVVKTVGKPLGVLARSVVALGQSGAHFVIAQCVMSVTNVIAQASRMLFAAAQAQASAAVGFGAQKFSHSFPGVAMDSVASIGRLTAKVLGVGTKLLVSHIRGIVSLIMRPVVQPQMIGSVTSSRAVHLITLQPRRSRVVSWFHLFVPDWAYQQTVLLPPSGGPAEPPAFGVIDPDDQTTFAFDWSARAAFNDPIVSASVTSSPPGMTFLGPVFTGGTLIEVTALPFTPRQLPMVYRLRCTAVFSSGRRSSFSIPVPIRSL